VQIYRRERWELTFSGSGHAEQSSETKTIWHLLDRLWEVCCECSEDVIEYSEWDPITFLRMWNGETYFQVLSQSDTDFSNRVTVFSTFLQKIHPKHILLILAESDKGQRPKSFPRTRLIR